MVGHSKHLLDIQYRMHPSISFFPNTKFYQNRIIDAPKVKCESYARRYLSGPMFGPYSFINVSGGREVFDDRNSRKNLVEVAVVVKIIQLLFKGTLNGVSLLVECDTTKFKRLLQIGNWGWGIYILRCNTWKDAGLYYQPSYDCFIINCTLFCYSYT